MLAAVQLAFTYVPAMNRPFASQPLAAADLLLAGGALLLLLEAEKAVVRRYPLFRKFAP